MQRKVLFYVCYYTSFWVSYKRPEKREISMQFLSFIFKVIFRHIFCKSRILLVVVTPNAVMIKAISSQSIV